MTTADKLTLTIILLLLPWVYFWAWHNHEDARWIKITQSGQEPRYYAINETRTLDIEGPLGTTTIQIEGGQARFVSSPCPNKLCIHSGWLKSANDFAACLPNRISMIFAGDTQIIDSMNY